MSASDYKLTVTTVAVCMGMIVEQPIPDMLNAIDRADSVGPILDPTLWRAKHKSMAEDREMLEAALPLWRLAQKMRDRMGRLDGEEATQ